jgi:phosphatidylserine decarboxylase
MSEIRYWHREKRELCRELVFGEAQVKWFHQNPIGKLLTHTLLTQNWVSRAYGYFQDRPSSAKKVPDFVAKFKIDMSEYEKQKYYSFNDFFIRKFKSGRRPFAENADLLCAPAEARYLAFEKISDETVFPVKEMSLQFPQLLNFHPLAERFRGGPAMIARLCPTDYHRFHYPDDGELVESLRAGTKLY